MTISYSAEVGESRYGTFVKLLFRWKGSIYRLVFRELFTFIVLYYFLAIIYRCVLDSNKQRTFEAVVRYCREYTDMIPLTFILGFYVSLVAGRWWSVYMNLPWPDRTCMMISAFVQGSDEKGRLLRRSMARHINAGALIVLQSTSSVIKKRFPTDRHIFDAGIMTEGEWKCYQQMQYNQSKWFLPFVWFNNLAMQARKEGRIHDDILLKALIKEMLSFRSCCAMLLSYDWVCVPLVYTQVVTLAVYSYFAACIMSSQFMEVDATESISKTYDLMANSTLTSDNDILARSYDWSVTKFAPCFTLIQFFFYTGWLKVAEVLINPLGSDDEDFELNWLVDRNLEISYLMVDQLYAKCPEPTRDMHWDQAQFDLPYTAASIQHKIEPFMGSTANFNNQHQRYLDGLITKARNADFLSQCLIYEVNFHRYEFAFEPKFLECMELQCLFSTGIPAVCSWNAFSNPRIPKQEHGWVKRNSLATESLAPTDRNDTPIQTGRLSRYYSSFRPLRIKRMVSRSISNISSRSRRSRGSCIDTPGDSQRILSHTETPSRKKYPRQQGFSRSKSDQPRLSPVSQLSTGSIIDVDLNNILMQLQSASPVTGSRSSNVAEPIGIYFVPQPEVNDLELSVMEPSSWNTTLETVKETRESIDE